MTCTIQAYMCTYNWSRFLLFFFSHSSCSNRPGPTCHADTPGAKKTCGVNKSSSRVHPAVKTLPRFSLPPPLPPPRWEGRCCWGCRGVIIDDVLGVRRWQAAGSSCTRCKILVDTVGDGEYQWCVGCHLRPRISAPGIDMWMFDMILV